MTNGASQTVNYTARAVYVICAAASFIQFGQNALPFLAFGTLAFTLLALLVVQNDYHRDGMVESAKKKFGSYAMAIKKSYPNKWNTGFYFAMAITMAGNGMFWSPVMLSIAYIFLWSTFNTLRQECLRRFAEETMASGVHAAEIERAIRNLADEIKIETGIEPHVGGVSKNG